MFRLVGLFNQKVSDGTGDDESGPFVVVDVGLWFSGPVMRR